MSISSKRHWFEIGILDGLHVNSEPLGNLKTKAAAERIGMEHCLHLLLQTVIYTIQSYQSQMIVTLYNAITFSLLFN